MSTGLPSINTILKDQLFLGNFAAAQSSEHRRKFGVTHIVSVCHEYPSAGGVTSTHLHIPVEDTEYEDLLIHLPKTYRFIQDALDKGGRVLVHCMMGVSRSTTVVAAFLMKSRKMDAPSALRYIKQRRPQVHPNYGFIKQLDTYAKCQYEPSPSNATYRSWKKRQGQDVTSFLNQLVDTVSIIPDKLLLSSDFPDDTRQAESLLTDLGITHVLSISPAELSPIALSATLKSSHHHRHIHVRSNVKEDLLLALPGAVKYLEEAMNERDGLILVYSQMEVRACTVACAFLMKQRRLAPDEAFSIIEDALPLFSPSINFSRNLEMYDACGYQPTRGHPFVQEWLSSDRPELQLGKSQNSDSSSTSYSKLLLSASGSTHHFSSPSSTSTHSIRFHETKVLSQQPSHISATKPPFHTPTTTSGQPKRVQSTGYSLDLEARAKDILSETGLDLAAFGDALKEIENRGVYGSSPRKNGREDRYEVRFSKDSIIALNESMTRRQQAA